MARSKTLAGEVAWVHERLGCEAEPYLHADECAKSLGYKLVLGAESGCVGTADIERRELASSRAAPRHKERVISHEVCHALCHYCGMQWPHDEVACDEGGLLLRFPRDGFLARCREHGWCPRALCESYAEKAEPADVFDRLLLERPNARFVVLTSRGTLRRWPANDGPLELPLDLEMRACAVIEQAWATNKPANDRDLGVYAATIRLGGRHCAVGLLL